MIVKRIGVLTSGGDAPGMNAAIRAVVRAGIDYGLEVYAIHNGYLGLYEGDFERMYRKSVSEKLRLGGTFIGTARLKEFADPKVREVAIENLKHYDIDALICLGGDGTYHGAQALYEMGIPTIGVPCTIDNDLAGTEFTIGFDTALNTAVDCVDKLRDTSTSHHRCSIIEVMGRNCGDLAIWTAIAVGAEFVIKVLVIGQGCAVVAAEQSHFLSLFLPKLNALAQPGKHFFKTVFDCFVFRLVFPRKLVGVTAFDGFYYLFADRRQLVVQFS